MPELRSILFDAPLIRCDVRTPRHQSPRQIIRSPQNLRGSIANVPRAEFAGNFGGSGVTRRWQAQEISGIKNKLFRPGAVGATGRLPNGLVVSCAQTGHSPRFTGAGVPSTMVLHCELAKQ